MGEKVAINSKYLTAAIEEARRKTLEPSELREEKVRAAKAKLESGELDSRELIGRAAEALLGLVDEDELYDEE